MPVIYTFPEASGEIEYNLELVTIEEVKLVMEDMISSDDETNGNVRIDEEDLKLG